MAMLAEVECIGFFFHLTGLSFVLLSLGHGGSGARGRFRPARTLVEAHFSIFFAGRQELNNDYEASCHSIM